MKDIFDVVLTKNALKDLKIVPDYIAVKLWLWVDDVGHRGLSEVRKIPGYHDEPLQGIRNGQRSIRLNKSYRAIYIIKADDTIEFVEIKEINKHKY